MPITSTNGSFNTHVKAIVAHYKGDPKQAYSLPSLATDAVVSNADINKWLKEAEADIRGIVDGVKADLIKAAEDYEANHNIQSFNEKVKAGKERAKKKTNESIDKWSDTVQTLAEKYPEQQDFLLGTFENVINFLNSIINAFNFLIENVIGIINQGIANVTKAIAKFIGDLGQSISTFFSNISGGRAALADTGIVKLLPSA